MLHTSSKRFAGWYQTANLLEKARNKYHRALWLLRSSTNMGQKSTIAKWMESNKKTNDGSCISIQVSHSFQVTLKSPWVTKCSLFLLIDRSRFPRNSHSRRPDRPPLQDVPNLKKIALPVGNSLILFTFWTSNTVLGSLSAIGIWKIVWFFQKIKMQQTWKSASCLFGSNFSPTGFSWTNPCFPNTWFGYNSKSQKFPSFDDESNL